TRACSASRTARVTAWRTTSATVSLSPSARVSMIESNRSSCSARLFFLPLRVVVLLMVIPTFGGCYVGFFLVKVVGAPGRCRRPGFAGPGWPAPSPRPAGSPRRRLGLTGKRGGRFSQGHRGRSVPAGQPAGGLRQAVGQPGQPQRRAGGP